MDRRKFIRGGIVTFGAIALSGCHIHGHGAAPAPAPVRARRPGPPPHAPAHGYRHHHHSGVDLVFDHGLGVYTVVGMPYYYYRGYFYRHHRGAWERSREPRRGWRHANRKGVPRKLRHKYERRNNGRGHGRGRDKDLDDRRDRRY